MAIRRIYRKKFHGVMLKSGYIYTFKYQAWANDPTPVIIFMYSLEGNHPNTGHQFRFLQAINFTYIPKSMRRTFANEWARVFEATNGNVRFTWDIVKRRYPYLKHAVRRYFIKPNYYISKLQEIPFEDMEKVIVSTWSKDFSKKVKVSLLQKFRSAMRGRKEIKRKARRWI
jgi:hypothetical protein